MSTETQIDPMVTRILDAVQFRIADSPHNRSAWEQKLVSTWGTSDAVWEVGQCKGCAKEIPAPDPGAPDEDNPFMAAIQAHAATVCEDCLLLAEDHYRRGKTAKPKWWEANCPPRIREILSQRTAEKVDWERVSRVEQWDFSKENRGLILTGDTGAGKTTALWALGRRLETQGRSLLLLTSIELSRRLQAAAKDMREDRELMDCPHLLIDDLGKEKLTATVGAAIYELIDTRLNFNKWMAFTTRFTGEQLEERFTETHLGRDIRRRIQDACKHLKFSGGGI